MLARIGSTNLPELEGEKLALGAAEAPVDLDAESQRSVERDIDGAFVFGYRVVMLVATGAVVVSALGAALLIEDRKPEEEPDDGSEARDPAA